MSFNFLSSDFPQCVISPIELDFSNLLLLSKAAHCIAALLHVIMGYYLSPLQLSIYPVAQTRFSLLCACVFALCLVQP